MLAQRLAVVVTAMMAAIGAGFAVAASAQTAPAADADYPSKPIKLIVSAAAGGGNDMIARIVAERLQANWKQTVTVENRVGAGNNIAAEFVYKAPADGYTLLVSPPAPLVVNAALFKELRFDPAKLEPVSISSYIPNVLAVKPDSPFKTAQELIAFAKANPGKLNYGSQGNGTTGHLTAALFEMLIGAKHAHVPYAGAAPALNDLVAGHIDFIFADIGTVLPLAADGKLRMLAATVTTAPAVAKSLPTVADIGMPELLSDTWTAFTAPPGTPLAIREKVAAAIREIMFVPEIKARLEAVGVEPWGLGPKAMAELVAKETKRWTDVVHSANVRLQ